MKVLMKRTVLVVCGFLLVAFCAAEVYGQDKGFDGLNMSMGNLHRL